MSLDIPYIPFGTKGWGGQVGQRVVFKGHHGTSPDVPWCPGTEGWDGQVDSGKFLIHRTTVCPKFPTDHRWTCVLNICSCVS